LIRLLLDQGLPRSTVTFLRAVGWDVQHVGDVGMSRASDQEILEYARGERRVCVTLDADFHSWLAVGGASGPSTVRIRIEGLNGRALAELLQRVWPMVRDDLDKGSMATITERNVRMHRLPIGRGGEP
jgi:predicted nuclease of predicted toxin-antitoxin system